MSLSRLSFEEAQKQLRISSIPSSVRRTLAMHLDAPCESNWEYLAEEMEVLPMEIMWLKNKVVHSRITSPTFQLFDEYLLPQDYSLEKFLLALQKIKNFACVRVLTEEYEKGAFDKVLQRIHNECTSGTNSLQKQYLLSHTGNCRSVGHQCQDSPSCCRASTSFCHSAEYPKHIKLNMHVEENRKHSLQHPYISSDGSFSSGSTCDSTIGIVGDSISFTHLHFDSDNSSEISGRNEYCVPMTEAIFRKENGLPSLSDNPRWNDMYNGNGDCRQNNSFGMNDIALDLSQNCRVKVEKEEKDEHKCCCGSTRCEENVRSRLGPHCNCNRCTYNHGCLPPVSGVCYNWPEHNCEPKKEVLVSSGCVLPCSSGENAASEKPRPVKREELPLEPETQAEAVEVKLERENSPADTDERCIRVFVTYAEDSKKHMKKVMQLCDCLKKNNFSVSIDVRENSLLSQDKMGWYDKRFKAADYVLVLISPKYYTDVTEREEHNTNSKNESTLNTLYIHRCMQAEYMMNSCLNKRFIPILMPDSSKDHVPVWLRNTTIYIWPDQYKNLFFYMMYPAQVISDFVIREKSAKTPTIQKTNH